MLLAVAAALPLEDQKAEESAVEAKAEVQKRGIGHGSYGPAGFGGKIKNGLQSAPSFVLFEEWVYSKREIVYLFS